MSDSAAEIPARGTITADDLRRVAEWADGVRGGEYRLSMNAPLPGGGTGFGLERVDGNSSPADEISISTPRRVPNKKSPPVFMLVDPATGENIRVDTQKHDAIFWGEVSAEKFLIPYYTKFLDDAGMKTLREAIADPAADQPWSMLMFQRGQGLLTQISLIEYAADPAPWALPAFSGALYPPDAPPDQGARLRRVWLGASDLNRAAADLIALGFSAAGPVVSDFAPHAGTLFRGSRADLVLVPGTDGVARLDIDGAAPQRVELTPDLALVCGEA